MTTPPRSALRVLLADDDPATRRRLATCLEEGGIAVRTATDGDDALARLDEAVDVAVLDLYLPGRTGLETLDALRRRQPDLEVLVLSAEGGRADVRRALETGAFHHVPRPVEPDDLVSLVRQAARTSRLVRDNRALRAGRERPPPPDLAGWTLDELEERALRDTLRACGGNKAAAARSLGVCEKTVYNKLRRLR